MRMPGYPIDLGLRVTDLTRLSRVCRRPRQIHSPCSRCWFSLLIVVATTISSMARFDGDADLFAGCHHDMSNIHLPAFVGRAWRSFSGAFWGSGGQDSGYGALGEGSPACAHQISKQGTDENAHAARIPHRPNLAPSGSSVRGHRRSCCCQSSRRWCRQRHSTDEHFLGLLGQCRWCPGHLAERSSR